MILFRNYYRRTDVTCTGDCKTSTLCDARKAHHSDALCKGSGKVESKHSTSLYGRGETKSSIKFTLKDKKEAMEYVRSLNKAAAKDKCKI